MTPTLRLLVSVQTLSEPVGLGGTECASSRPKWTGDDAADWLYVDILLLAVLVVWRVECLIEVVCAAKLDSEPSTANESMSGIQRNKRDYLPRPYFRRFVAW